MFAVTLSACSFICISLLSQLAIALVKKLLGTSRSHIMQFFLTQNMLLYLHLHSNNIRIRSESEGNLDHNLNDCTEVMNPIISLPRSA